MKLGDYQNKLCGKDSDDVRNRLDVELRRCMAGQNVKRKEIARLENIITQKDQELEKAKKIADTCQQEAARYSKRVNELEVELKETLAEQSHHANVQLKNLSDHLTELRGQNETLRREKHNLEEKLDETLANQEETIRKMHQETLAQQEKTSTNEYNKEYLEIHNKAVERVRQEAQIEIVQLTVQLESTEKELISIKEDYIKICGIKEQLINDHENEIKKLKDTYANLEIHKTDMEKLTNELTTQMKIVSRLTNECDGQKKKIIELEKDLSCERRKKSEYLQKIHDEIEKTRQEALFELRSAHPDHQISFLLPDHCPEHSNKIVQLEADYKRLEEKLQDAAEEQKKMFELQNQVTNTKVKLVQMEISHETLKKKYENIIKERSELLKKINNYEYEAGCTKKNSDRHDLDVELKLDNERLRSRCDSLLKEKDNYKQRISNLEIQLTECRASIIDLNDKLSRPDESWLISQSELEQQLAQYKEIFKQYGDQLNNTNDNRNRDLGREDKLKQLELKLQEKEAQLQRLQDLEKIKDERDQLVTKLKHQAKIFEQYVHNQKKVQDELNLSPRSAIDGVDFQKLREMSTKEVREEMEQKVAEELRIIEDKHREKQKGIEQQYQVALAELHERYNKQTEQVLQAERKKLESSFKAQEQAFTQIFKVKLDEYKRELIARNEKIEQFQTLLRQKENESEEEKNDMAQVMSEWIAEIQTTKETLVKLQEENNILKENEKKFNDEIQGLKIKIREMKESIDTVKQKYQKAKTTASNYKVI